MKRIVLSASLALALCGCSLLPPAAGGSILPPPSSFANSTKIDEQTGIAVTLAYTAAARAAALAINTGLIKDKPTIARIGALDRQAYAAVQAVRAAYLTANSDSYVAAIMNANSVVGALLTATKGN